MTARMPRASRQTIAGRYQVAVTFESPMTAPPDTVRVEVAARTLPTAAARACREAKRLRPGKRWTSVVLLIERAEAA